MDVYGYRDCYILDHGLRFDEPLTSEQMAEIRTLFEETEARRFWIRADMLMILPILLALYMPTRPMASPFALFVLVLVAWGYSDLIEAIFI